MPSPFPGMDPYLEDPSVWEEFHHVLITEAMYQLSDRLPDGYIAKIQERVKLVSTADDAAKQYLPDVAVSAGRPAATAPDGAGARPLSATTAVLEPVTIPA